MSEEEAPDEELTDREAQVLKGLTRGLTNKGLSQHFGISRATVRNHLSHIYGKLGVGSRAEAVAAGFRRGLLQ